MKNKNRKIGSISFRGWDTPRMS